MSNQSRILIVDDNPVNRKLLVAAMRRAGHATVEAADGEEAIALATAEVPDLVLLDVSMPGRDGFDVCRTLKADARTASVPILFLTALTGAEQVDHAFAVGGSDYIAKPFHLNEVKARVSVHLRLGEAQRELRQAHADLLQAQKLESIGQLAAGIAHEINTPAQYLGDNTRFLADALEEVLPLLARARAICAAARAGESVTEAAEQFERIADQIEIDWLANEIPRALQQSLDGLDRMGRIVGAMKEFSHPGVGELVPVDLHRAIENAIVVGRSEWKYVADVQTDFDPRVPQVPCLPGEISQVVLNLLVNAAHAIGDVVRGSGNKGTIRVRTRRLADSVEISVSDDGTGIRPDARARIFDPFFTTKEVGKGTGQGLPLARAIVVRKHRGTIDFETEVGRGTTFFVRLPLVQENAEAQAA